MNNEGIRAIVLSYLEVGIGGKSKDIVNAILNIIKKDHGYLIRQKSLHKIRFPEYIHDIPLEKNLIIKNCLDVVGTIDMYNQACKSCKLVFDKVDNIINKEPGV